MVDCSRRCWFGLAAVGLAVLFTSGRLGLHKSNPQRLRFVHTYTTESERAILNEAIAEFERAHPPIKIDQVVYNSETYQTIGWRLQFQGARQSDIFFTWQGFKVEHAIENAWALDLAPYLSKEFVEQFVPSAIPRQRGGIYFLPQSIDISNLVWYNQDIFEKLGLREPKSLSEWLQLCVQLRKAGLLALGQGNRDLWPMGNFGAELMGQRLGADGLGELFGRSAQARVDDFRGLGAFDFLRRNGCFDLPGTLEPDGIGALGDIDAKVLFLSGKSVQHVVGSWFLADVEDARRKN
jgi:raffinose/stachyose/melibiose transport system substrate-binding protein